MRRLFIILIIYGASMAASPVCLSNNQAKADSLVKVIKTEKGDTIKVKNLNYLSKYFLTSDPDKSLDYARQALALAQQLNFTEYIFNAYQDIAGYYYYRSDIKQSMFYFKKALSIIENTNRKSSIGKAYSNLSLLAIKQLDYSGSIEYSEKSMQIALELKDSTMIATILNNRAILYINIADYPSALNSLLKSLSINEEKRGTGRMASNYYYIGYTYMLETNYTPAINYFQLSLEASKKSNDKFQLAQALDKIGEVYQQKKDWSRALDYFQQAIAIGREVGSFDNIISSTQNIGMIYNEQGKYTEAIQSINNALALSEQVNDKMGTGNNYGYLGEIYLKQNDFKTAIGYFQNSIRIAKDINAKDNTAYELLNLSKCYNGLHDYQAAYDVLSEYNVLKDSIISREKVKMTAEAQAKYDLDKKEKEIAILTKNKEIQGLEIRKRTTLNNSLIAGIILICILFFFVYRFYRTQQLLKLQTLRNKIASDLHDDIGSTLSSIAIFSEIARQESKEVAPMLDQIGESSRKMLESMADIVWTINPENDSFERIILRMRFFAYELLGTKNIDFEFTADDSIINLKLSMDVRKNLYLIFKEAINNMVKYADADRASFSIHGSNNNLMMLIRDNGKGFDPEKQTLGNGLKNMRSRAADMGARFLIESEIGKGTTIQLSLKTA